MMRAVLAVILTIATAGGCAQFLSSPQSRQEGDARLVEKLAEAQKLQQDGRFAEALDAYKKIVQEDPGSESAATAKFDTALILVSADNSRRDYAQAIVEFEEFISQFPTDRRAPEARSWRILLKTALDSKKENERLNKNIEMLKQLDLKQEEKRRVR